MTPPVSYTEESWNFDWMVFWQLGNVRETGAKAREEAGKCLISGFVEIYLRKDRTERKPILKYKQSHYTVVTWKARAKDPSEGHNQMPGRMPYTERANGISALEMKGRKIDCTKDRITLYSGTGCQIQGGMLPDTAF